VKSGGCDPRTNGCRGASLLRAVIHIIYSPAPRFPARLVRYFFSRLDTPRILSCPRAGPVSNAFFGCEKGTCGSELAAGVEAGGGQPGRSARAWRSLAVDQSCEPRVLPKGEARSYSCRRRVASGGATRLGGGGPQDRPPPEKPGAEVFRINISIPHLVLRSGDSIRVFTKPFP
jgi:hypothetical protein